MTSNRPYLIRAFYDWIVDNGLTPYLLVDAEFPNAQLPLDFAEEGQIVLNVNPGAVKDLLIDNYLISFNARFAEEPFSVSFPPDAVLGIYAKENGQGMLFEPAARSAPAPEQDDHDSAPRPAGPPSLKIVK